MIFIDRSIPRRVAESLREMDVDVVWLEERFAHDAPDAEWLRVAGREGWVAVTRVKRIRTNPAARHAIEEARACVVVFEQRQPLLTSDYVEKLVALLPEIEVLPTGEAAIYAITREGNLRRIMPRGVGRPRE